VNTKDSIT